eukprot:g27931.t1
MQSDTSQVQDQLINVKQLFANDSAFAALLENGEEIGGDCSDLNLTDVKSLCSSGQAFAALLGDGSVKTWGRPHAGGCCTAVKESLQDVAQLCGSSGAFAALLGSGEVVTWGDPKHGGCFGESHWPG